MVVMKGVYAPRHWPILDSDGMITVSKTIAVYLVSYLPIPSNETKSSLLLKYMGWGGGIRNVLRHLGVGVSNLLSLT